MVIPWVGFPLGGPGAAGSSRPPRRSTSRSRRCSTPSRCPGSSAASSTWPYVEGLRLDEALHPLALLAVGLYGRVLPNQNGAPLRLVVPWKYGFKGIKSIVTHPLRRAGAADHLEPAWRPSEYGFYANVNPEVDHPRWSQAKERRIGEFLQAARRCRSTATPTQVAHLYAGMDLRKSSEAPRARRGRRRLAVFAVGCLPATRSLGVGRRAGRAASARTPSRRSSTASGSGRSSASSLSLVSDAAPHPHRRLGAGRSATGAGSASSPSSTACLHFAHLRGRRPVLRPPPILDDVAKRKFITVGFAAFVLLVPLALTSNDRAVRRLGFVRWKRRHRLVYVCAVLGVIHFVWRVKAGPAAAVDFRVRAGGALGNPSRGGATRPPRRRRGLRCAATRWRSGH